MSLLQMHLSPAAVLSARGFAVFKNSFKMFRKKELRIAFCSRLTALWRYINLVVLSV